MYKPVSVNQHGLPRAPKDEQIHPNIKDRPKLLTLNRKLNQIAIIFGNNNGLFHAPTFADNPLRILK